jgi:uncharacterized protein (TIGR02594 family)
MAENEAPWLDLMLADVGMHEITGKDANAAILRFYADVGHPECQSDEIAWCAAFQGSALKRSGNPIPPVNVNLMARSYCTYGHTCELQRGAIVVFPRGKSTWQGHVACVVEVYADGRFKYVAGNQSDSVSYGYAFAGDVLPGAVRWPVAPTVAALRNAGSSTIKRNDQIEKTGIVAVFFAPILKGIEAIFNGAPGLNSSEGLSYWQIIGKMGNETLSFITGKPWWLAIPLAGVGLWGISYFGKRKRVAEHAAGIPISAEVSKLGG